MTDKPKRGRPLTGKEPLSERLPPVSCGASQLASWRAAAEEQGMGLMAWARAALDRAAKNPLTRRTPRT